jgi:hypothetical protein
MMQRHTSVYSGGRPAFLDWTKEQRMAAVVPVLRGAYSEILRGMWLPSGAINELESRRERLPARAVSLQGALCRASGHPDLPYSMDTEWARAFLRKIAGEDLHRWESHPFRTKDEVLGLLSKALGIAGEYSPRRGGWTVTHGSVRV